MTDRQTEIATPRAPDGAKNVESIDVVLLLQTNTEGRRLLIYFLFVHYLFCCGDDCVPAE